MEIEKRVMPLMFLLTGVANVLLIKYTDIEKGQCSDGKWRNFQHPLFQTALMFLGQLILLIVFKVTYWFLHRREDGSENENFITRGGREFSLTLFILPAFLDAISSVLLFTGLYLTYASSFQMIRGAAIIFVGIYSSIYLNQDLISRHWISMLIIACAMAIILSNDVQRIVYDRASLIHVDSNAILTGDLLIICAQVFHAAQIVYEEKHLKDSDIPPMQAAGLQGLFGFGITIILATALNFMPTELAFINNSRGVFDDMTDVFLQLGSNIWILIALLAFVLTSALYNYSALSIVKFSSSTNRTLADGLRIMLIWLFAFFFNWEILNFVSFLGFIILSMGAISYRNAILIDWYRSVMARLMRNRYADLTIDGTDPANMPISQPADLI